MINNAKVTTLINNALCDNIKRSKKKPAKVTFIFKDKDEFDLYLAKLERYRTC